MPNQAISKNFMPCPAKRLAMQWLLEQNISYLINTSKHVEYPDLRCVVWSSRVISRLSASGEKYDQELKLSSFPDLPEKQNDANTTQYYANHIIICFPSFPFLHSFMKYAALRPQENGNPKFWVGTFALRYLLECSSGIVWETIPVMVSIDESIDGWY